MSETKEIHGFCSICVSRCGTINTVVDDMLVKVRADPNHPNGKAVCMKGRAAPELAHHPDRLLYPLRRTTPKGAPSPEWERISWDSALTLISEKLNEIRVESGAEALVVGSTTPSGSMCDSFEWVKRFSQIYGTPNFLGTTEICNWHKDDANILTFGCPTPPGDHRNADVILLWGNNPTNTWLAQADAIGQGRSAGAKLIVVDPRPTQLARQADLWLQVRPGTDAALAMGIAKAMIDSGAMDVDFVRQWSNAPLLVRSDNGKFLRESDFFPDVLEDRFAIWNLENRWVEFSGSAPGLTPTSAAIEGVFAVNISFGKERLKVNCSPAFEHFRRAVAPYTPEFVEGLTGIPAHYILEAAQLLRRGQRISHYAWSGVGQHGNATQTARAIATLYALTGAFDRKGANWVLKTHPVNRVEDYHSFVTKEQQKKALGLGTRPLGPASKGVISIPSLCNSLLGEEGYKIRALLTFGLSPHTSNVDPPRLEKALKSLEFHVHCDLFETPASHNADILLPSCSLAEREALRVGFEINEDSVEHVQVRPRLITPRGESKPDYQIIFDLAVRLGFDSAFFNGDVVAGWNHILEPLGIDVAELRARAGGMRLPIRQTERKYAATNGTGGFQGFATPSGRVELYSEALLTAGYDAVPVYRSAAQGSGCAPNSAYPYLLSSAKNGYYCHSQHRNLASLRKRSPFPIVEISAALSRHKGIEDGDWVRVETEAGNARFKAKVLPELAFDVLVAEFGWWQACEDLGLDALPLSGDANSNFSNLVSGAMLDPVSGSSSLRSVACDVILDQTCGPRRWSGYREFAVVETREEAEGVRTVRLQASDGGALPHFLPGQHITCQFPSLGDVTRSYSLTGPADLHGGNSYSISVRHARGISTEGVEHEGLVSSHIHKRLRVGDRVSVKAPNGVFVIPKRAKRPLVLFAGGIGITPFLSFLESVVRETTAPEIYLFYSNRNRRTHAFRERIAAVERQLPSLSVVNYYDEKSAEDPAGSVIGRITANAVSDDLIQARARFYFCGPGPMMTALTKQLVDRGVPPFDIFSEAFKSPSLPNLQDIRRFQVHFKRSNKIVEWSADAGPLLSLGEKSSIPLASGCRVGQCESCSVRVIAGSVAHLSGDGPEEPGMCFACQAIPTSDLVVDA
ncbi:molybdopterin-dependent oxidoreductase [Cupriavidus sp. IK-TO18]|uniref:molybdopterin-dependent oxidoreductase n=1 Tax=Cupriavidus sp. IK-TO18 TaxID=2782182 RepID=UPI001899DE49|nr:molybdopterin-dependent oxidoreductase [Cupriavidus sp. IK-TO18]